ncbi:PSP1 domain-containing protein [Tenacibaculum haliotis]|uniref:PSP1 domain-containing protein n=1 Tax=Tenacibaculum haliotis TaxID=1888914 RepID=UPI0021AF9360|nr:regulatory iron-sulfur-containing complex subunit RicT [Tenacibaculum haliotis]MCT4700159.1 regulatory iron-sulfur-containing complex subunit RicT [Tenacibaculum haliotis]
MSCNSCSTSKDGVPNGCKSNGNCASGTCGSGNKLAVFDWLSNMTLPTGEAPFNIFEVRFKNGRKHFYKNTEKLTVSMGDVVAVEGSSGHDIGIVALAGELVKVQMKKRKVAVDSEEVNKIYRKATQKDIDIWHAARDKEQETQRKGREIISRLELKMKLSDVEYQGDGTKATFYYTADERVDFRQLIRDLAGTFSIRVEMKQVGMRQEAARLGGVGSCGRELCCSTWLTDFRKVNTAAARYQQLSLNPLKLAGQCGKLKCCLNFELDTYLDALQSFPKQDKILKTEKGDAVFVKMDIFKKILWYTYKHESFKWFQLSLDQVQEIIELNKNNELALPLDEYELEIVTEAVVDFENVVGQDSLTRFDAPKKSRGNNKKRPQRKPANKNRSVGSPETKPKRRPQRNPVNKSGGVQSADEKSNKSPQRKPVRKVVNKDADKKTVATRKPKPRNAPRVNNPKSESEKSDTNVQSQNKKPNNQKRRNNNQRRKKPNEAKNNEKKNEKE